MDLQPWLRSILEGLVSEPTVLVITEKTDAMGILFTISSSNKRDIGMLIGRNGANVNALRTVLRNSGHLRDVKASLKVITS